MPEKIPRYVEVAVPLPVRTALTYRLPAALAGSAAPGARAVVPVGRRIVTGVIVGRREEAPLAGAELKDVIELPDEAPIIPEDLLGLAHWATRYYVAPPGSMIAATLPPGIGRRSETVVRRAEVIPAGTPERLRAALATLPGDRAVPRRRLRWPPALLADLRDAGLVQVETHLMPARVRARTTRRLALSRPDRLEEDLASCGRAPRQQEVLRLLAGAGRDGLTLEEVRGHLGRAGPALSALTRKGLVRSTRVPVRREPSILAGGRATPPERLTGPQTAALQELTRCLGEGTYRAFLLMGVTGSGKTEVYLRAIQECLRRGRQAIYLVPEIGLTPLLARDLRARLGPDLAILHSSLPPGERFDEWRRAREGRARVVLGARSAVLAPLPGLGLVVVDEEQDASYKQEEDPRYNARDLAQVRAKEAAALVILGSATPSVETCHAALSGRIGLLKLAGRVHDRPMASVRLVDMREEFARTGRDDLISEPLRQAVEERLAKGEQAILLLNRRGYAPFALCRSCGARETCRRCSLSLTYHRAGDRMRCHYCGYQRGRPARCATCGSDKMALMGAGTERLEQVVREAFPRARLARLDRDTARGPRAVAEILSRFERGEHNLLVGTQMVAKGHDFPGVTIVGVLGADNVLALPDFRAAERTFQLLTQVAGRSGRGAEPGEVIVQAFHCEHYAMQAAAAQSYDAFYEKESRFRRIMKYPPFVVMANLLVLASSPEAGVRRVRLAAEALEAAAGDGLQILGPGVAPIARLKGRYRYQILVKGASRRRLSDALNEAAAALAGRGLASTRDLVIDMDPVTLT